MVLSMDTTPTLLHLRGLIFVHFDDITDDSVCCLKFFNDKISLDMVVMKNLHAPSEVSKTSRNVINGTTRSLNLSKTRNMQQNSSR